MSRIIYADPVWWTEYLHVHRTDVLRKSRIKGKAQE
jgi:hypothetical protein